MSTFNSGHPALPRRSGRAALLRKALMTGATIAALHAFNIGAVVVLSTAALGVTQAAAEEPCLSPDDWARVQGEIAEMQKALNKDYVALNEDDIEAQTEADKEQDLRRKAANLQRIQDQINEYLANGDAKGAEGMRKENDLDPNEPNREQIDDLLRQADEAHEAMIRALQRKEGDQTRIQNKESEIAKLKSLKPCPPKKETQDPPPPKDPPPKDPPKEDGPKPDPSPSPTPKAEPKPEPERTKTYSGLGVNPPPRTGFMDPRDLPPGDPRRAQAEENQRQQNQAKLDAFLQMYGTDSAKWPPQAFEWLKNLLRLDEIRQAGTDGLLGGDRPQPARTDEPKQKTDAPKPAETGHRASTTAPSRAAAPANPKPQVSAPAVKKSGTAETRQSRASGRTATSATAKSAQAKPARHSTAGRTGMGHAPAAATRHAPAHGLAAGRNGVARMGTGVAHRPALSLPHAGGMGRIGGFGRPGGLGAGRIGGLGAGHAMAPRGGVFRR